MGCRAHLYHLLGFGQVGHPPRKPVGVLGPWTGAQYGWAPCPPASLWLRLTCGQMYQPLPPITPCPQERHLVARSDTTVGQVDIWSAFGSSGPMIRCTPTPMPPPHHPISPVEAATGQE